MNNPPTYQVRDWCLHFENDRSRSRRKCSFVCVPNKQHGMGFSRIMAEPDGSAIYGIWHCIIGACSQQTNRNGWLTMDGEPTGSPWGVDDMALKFRRPAAEIARALDFLASDKVQWLIKHIAVNGNDMPPTHRPLTADSPPTHLEEKGREGKEEKGREGNPASGECSEIPTAEEAIAMTMTLGCPESFTRFVYDDWTSRSGKDAGGVVVRFLPYVTKRWTREQAEWRSGTHKGISKAKAERQGPTLAEVQDYAKEKWFEDARHTNWAVSFYTYWNDPKRKWMRDGRLIEWKSEITKQVARWREK